MRKETCQPATWGELTLRWEGHKQCRLEVWAVFMLKAGGGDWQPEIDHRSRFATSHNAHSAVVDDTGSRPSEMRQSFFRLLHVGVTVVASSLENRICWLTATDFTHRLLRTGLAVREAINVWSARYDDTHEEIAWYQPRLWPLRYRYNASTEEQVISHVSFRWYLPDAILFYCMPY